MKRGSLRESCDVKSLNPAAAHTRATPLIQLNAVHHQTLRALLPRHSSPHKSTKKMKELCLGGRYAFTTFFYPLKLYATQADETSVVNFPPSNLHPRLPSIVSCVPLPFSFRCFARLSLSAQGCKGEGKVNLCIPRMRCAASSSCLAACMLFLHPAPRG